ncbi:glycosyltransferase [Pantoea anthophila]|uniref:glycosyltransferase n=1 Tax=Pantoea anthophila TaxID=470931 RepID=UPI002789E73E|nr:glycosyltransferase [Pantoea anthophila]MDQ1214956.1 glycosyltransferase involved in cell wall biosynthesis [Pantoea anthophila]
MNDMPLVSVYVPTYNRIELLKRALTSVLSQSYQNIEVIVVDDNSSDGTQEFLTEMAKQDDRVKPILKEQNSGACISRNMAIESAQGEFITGLDDDDYFLPGRITYFVENRHLLKKYIFLYTNFFTLTKSGQYKKTRYLDMAMPKEITSRNLLFKNIIGNQCFTYTQRMRCAGKFTPDMPAWQDMDLFYRLLNNTELKQARLLRQYLYVQDTSHDLNRITLSNKDKIHRAFFLFCEKNHITGKYQDILEVQLVSYGIKVRNSLFLTRLRSNTKLYFYFVDAFLFLKNLSNK